MDNEKLKLEVLIQERFDNLTKSEKRIATFLLQKPEEAAFLSVSELAAQLDLSEATAVRFAQALGFNGYPELRDALQDSFRHQVTHSTRIKERLSELRQHGNIFEQLVASEINYLTQALRTVDRAAITQAVELLQNSERIFIFSLGPSIPLVDLLAVRLTRFGRQVVTMTTTGREILEPLLLLNNRDVLFAIAFFAATPTLKFVLDYAQKVECPAILLTDTLEPVVGEKARVVLAARRGPVSSFHSLTVPMTLINAILLTLAQTDQERTLSSLDHLDELRRSYPYESTAADH
jgi:DNA-binding MurR/RpiR family transcriptional regulator